jgi:hypothetical protein
MIRMHPWDGGPEDDIWRLKARWNGDTLCYLSPGGTWMKLAEFVNGDFYTTENRILWMMKKACPKWPCEITQRSPWTRGRCGS